jgi:hypothetical protein
VQQAPNRNVRTIMILAIVGVLVVAVVSVGITLALTKDDGKSQTATPFQAPAPLPVATSSVPAPSVPTNARQNIEKQIRETAGFGGVTPGTDDVNFALTKITVDGRCTEPYAQKSQNGHLIFLEMSVSTSPTMDRTYASYVINPNNFSIIGPDGITQTGESLASMSAYTCLSESKQIPSTLAPGQKYLGTIVLDSRYTSGALVLAPGGGFSNGNGWEWKLGNGA